MLTRKGTNFSSDNYQVNLTTTDLKGENKEKVEMANLVYEKYLGVNGGFKQAEVRGSRKSSTVV